MPFQRFSHICFDVEDIEAMDALMSDLTGVASSGITTMILEGGKGLVKTSFLHFSTGSIELAYHDLPDSWKDSPLNTAPGFHHIGFEVDSMEKSLFEMALKGIRPLPRFPMKTPHGMVAFLDPKHTGGLLIEIREKVQA